jgi:hypothetical protein
VVSPQTEEKRLREQIESERAELAESVRGLRRQVGETTDLRAKLGQNLPLFVVGAVGAGFVFGGGLGATARLLLRRGREGRQKAKLGRLSVIER